MRWASGVYHSGIPSTIGANHQRKVISLRHAEVDLYVWDTAGQEQFQALTPLYARSAAAAVIVAAADDKASFSAITDWIHLLESSCDRVPPQILAINKTDLGECVLSEDDIHNEYGEKFQSIFHVSAKTGESIDTIFLSAAQIAYDFIQRGEQVRRSQTPEPYSESDFSCC
jgi:small GTP-binding protein